MNRERFKGILIGAAASALVMGFSVTAFAANRSITVSDGIQVLLNGQAFQPKDGNGSPVELFSYNGTIYAPIRAVCEAAGMEVSYDSNTKTASITTSATQQAAPAAQQSAAQQSAALLSEARAKEIALEHANVSAGNATFVEVKLSRGLSSSHYDIEFYSGNTEYDYEIDAVSGSILKYESDYKADRQQPQTQSGSTAITAERAQEIALQRAPGASVTKCKLDHDDGRQIYEIELRNGRTKYECEIDASSGTVLKWEVDN